MNWCKYQYQFMQYAICNINLWNNINLSGNNIHILIRNQLAIAYWMSTGNQSPELWTWWWSSQACSIDISVPFPSNGMIVNGKVCLPCLNHGWQTDMSQASYLFNFVTFLPLISPAPLIPCPENQFRSHNVLQENQNRKLWQPSSH